MERVVPTYYFDIYDNDKLLPDDFGAELANLYEARDQAIALLPDIARDALPDGDRHVFKIVVKCKGLRVRYVTTLTLDGAWVEPPTYPDDRQAD